MNGSLRQRSAGSWELRVFIGTDSDTGRRIDRSITVRGVRADAERALTELIGSVAQRRVVGPKSPVRDLLEAWFEIGATGWSPTTIRQHRSVLRCYLIPRLGDVRVGDVTASMINRMYVELRKGGGVGGRKLAASTLKRTRSVLHSSFGFAMREGWIGDNPVQRANRVTVPRSEMRPPSAVEFRRLAKFIAERDDVFYLFVSLAASTGARRAQMLALRWHNIGADYRSVSFTAGWVEGPNGPVRANEVEPGAFRRDRRCDRPPPRGTRAAVPTQR